MLNLSLFTQRFPSMLQRSAAPLAAVLMLCFSACEDDINPTLEDADPVVVIDAWINNKPEPQTIRLSTTLPYFENAQTPGVDNATVTVVDDQGNQFDFLPAGNGNYTWTPAQGEQFGAVGNQYVLNVSLNGRTYTASSAMNRVPTVDSVTFRYEEDDIFIDESFWAEFWSRDFTGAGDTYWIKTFKNGEFLAKPSEINVAYDAAFSEGGQVDGLIFIPPIRDLINPFDDDENDELLSPYSDGDSVFVEVHSITEDAFEFLVQVRLQTDRPGGFAELFATPLSNVPTNISSSDPNEEVIGFFSVSAVEGNGSRLIEANVPR